jgi:signal transduction histidine kinase/CheY-like chemotaxis protein
MGVLGEFAVHSDLDLRGSVERVRDAARAMGFFDREAAVLTACLEVVAAPLRQNPEGSVRLLAGVEGGLRVEVVRPSRPEEEREMERRTVEEFIDEYEVVAAGAGREKVSLAVSPPGGQAESRTGPALSAAEELLAVERELRRQETQVRQLTDELSETNRGVVALYAELEEKAELMRRSSDLKTRFLANMTHEFRTPLNAILNISRMLLDRLDGDLTAEQEKQVRFVQKGASDLSELVNDLLDLARVEAGRVVVRPSWFEVSDLFAALRGILRPLLLHGSRVSLVFGEAPEGLRMHTDEGKLAQILRNLVSNSLKFTEEGEVRLLVKQSGRMISFYIADTGIGIPPEDQERIFDEYVRLEHRRTRSVTGTGLGLPIARRLAEILGGEVRLENSVAGKGSVFSLTVPIVYQEPEPHRVPDEIEADPSRFPVLLFSETPEVFPLYEKFLRGTGFQLLPVSNGERALDLVRELKPVIVLINAGAPDGNGFRLLARLKRDDTVHSVPVWMSSLAEHEERATALGAEAFFAGPVPRDRLVHGLRQYCPIDSREEVLIVDDDELSRYLLRSLLQDTRLRVLEAESGVDGLELARQRRPFCIFLDLHMPDKSGFEVIKEMRADTRLAAVPLVVHTGIPLNADERAWLEAEGVPILSKSTQNRDLALAELRRVLQEAAVSQTEEVVRE